MDGKVNKPLPRVYLARISCISKHIKKNVLLFLMLEYQLKQLSLVHFVLFALLFFNFIVVF